jgi:hypothetical protein
MIELNVDDFGCVPDGRVLERVSIDADSAVLHAPEGSLRATDVGKNIAIPRAADLVATIALSRPLELRNAALTLDDPTKLTGTLFNPQTQKEDPQGLVARVHKDWRITVAGAGPGGETLLTTIAEVLDPPPSKTVRLVDAASRAVAPADNVKVILNDPKIAALSNYARRTVSDGHVDLGDRLITDARMTIGARELRSETARFSSLDVGKSVVIPAAGLFITTIKSVDSPTQATLTVPAPRAVGTLDEVQADVWKTDSRPGLEQLLASLATWDTESAEIRFGPGVYDFKRSPGGPNAAITLHGRRNLTLRGSGQGVTVVRLMPGQDVGTRDTHVIETADCRNLTFRDLSVHGAYLTLANAHEQMHGINIFPSSEEITVQHVTVFQSAGDGIRLVGNPGKKVSRVWVDSCRLIQNKRSGVSFQRGVEFVWVRNSYIDMTAPGSDQCVDFEPTGGGGSSIVAPTDVIIDSNIFVHGNGNPTGVAVAIGGLSGADPARRVKFANNVVLGGEVFCTDVAELTIQNNTVLFPDSQKPAGDLLSIQRGGDSVLISENVLISEHPGTGSVINLSEVNDRQVSRARVAGNLCITRSGCGIQVVASDDVAIEGNMLVATGPCEDAIRVDAQSSAINDVSVRGNDITVKDQGLWKTGILFGGGHPIHHISAVGNSIARATQGIAFSGTRFKETPVCASNRIEGDVANPLAGLPSLPLKAMVVGGAASRGGSRPGSGAGRFLVGVGDPNVPRGDPPSAVPGNVGDIYQRVDANAAAALYVKESGDGTTTGWVPK